METLIISFERRVSTIEWPRMWIYMIIPCLCPTASVFFSMWQKSLPHILRKVQRLWDSDSVCHHSRDSQFVISSGPLGFFARTDFDTKSNTDSKWPRGSVHTPGVLCWQWYIKPLSVLALELNHQARYCWGGWSFAYYKRTMQNRIIFGTICRIKSKQVMLHQHCVALR